MLSSPVVGKTFVAELIQFGTSLIQQRSYIRELKSGKTTILLWNGKISGEKMQGATILVDDEDGKVIEVSLLMRPWAAAERFRKRMEERFGQVIGKEKWGLETKSSTRELREQFLPRLELPMADDVVFYSPILDQNVDGITSVSNALSVIFEVQSMRKTELIFASSAEMVELFSTTVGGYKVEGLRVDTIGVEGKVSEILVLLRPWPAVTLLRDIVRSRSSLLLGGIGNCKPN
jgi:hypothetical protein